MYSMSLYIKETTHILWGILNEQKKLKNQNFLINSVLEPFKNRLKVV